jgi:hypothetical protein
MRRGIVRIGLVVTLVSIVLFAFGGVAIAAPPTSLGNVGQNGPTPPALGDPVANQSEVQWIEVTFTGAPSGTYTLTIPSTGDFAGGTTGNISATTGTDSATIGSPAKALNTLMGGSCSTVACVTATGGPTSANFTAGGALTGTFNWRLQWIGAWAGMDIGTVSANTGSLVGETIATFPYKNGATITPARVQPHGGYSAVTDYCLQCHSVHQAPGAGYSLLARSSVTDTCQTCHSIGPVGPTGAINPGLPGTEAPTSMRAAYENTAGVKARHTLGATTIPFGGGQTITESGWSYGGFNPATWDPAAAAGAGTSGNTAPSVGDGGLYCGDCHTPHGDFGQLVNAKQFRSTAGSGNSEVQQVSPIGFTYGGAGQTFTLTVKIGPSSATTGAITYGDTPASVAAALAGLSNVGAGNVAVTSSSTSAPYTSYKVAFQGTLANTNVDLITGSTAVTGASVEAGVLTDGGPAGSLDATYDFKEGAAFYNGRTLQYLHKDSDPVVWEGCPAATGVNAVAGAVDTVTVNSVTTACVYLTASDTEGETSYLYGYKLLSAYPNHSWNEGVESWNMDASGHDGSRWCGQCHSAATPSEYGGTYHNHPTGCTACHGNPNDATSTDFPHTTTFQYFLKDYPDLLCINCHSAGTLP